MQTPVELVYNGKCPECGTDIPQPWRATLCLKCADTLKDELLDTTHDGVCCAGHVWEVVDVTTFSVWGICDNAECRTIRDEWDPYERISNVPAEEWIEFGGFMP